MARTLKNNRIRNREWHLRQKKAAFALLGDKCIRCSFSDPRALQVDHINGDGYKDKKSNKTIRNYKEVIAGATRFQLLCANCNWIKRIENQEFRKRIE